MAITYMNIFQSKTLKNLPKLGYFGLKTNHLATLAVKSSHLAESGRGVGVHGLLLLLALTSFTHFETI
jgi:hypothetical protein